ncbi:MAG: DUF3551 domain-containing protein [Afipia sp.]|nr:DUF3551 domain-containing protein [Afipia sp.]
MRYAFLMAVALTGFATFGTGAADARPPYRYCLTEGFGRGPGICDYDTVAQCQASVSGRRGYCQLNPFYAFAEQGRPFVRPHKIRRHRHHRH